MKEHVEGLRLEREKREKKSTPAIYIYKVGILGGKSDVSKTVNQRGILIGGKTRIREERIF